MSTEGVELAAEYARAHDWTVNVRQLVIPADAAADPTFMHYSEVLSSRTPWVFRLSGDGIVLEERHGSEINLLPPTPR